MIQQEESSAVSEREDMKFGPQNYAYPDQLKKQGLYPDEYPEGTSLPNTDAHENAQQSGPFTGDLNEVRRDESFPHSFQCKSMQQPQSMDSLGTQASGKSITNSLNPSEQLILASVNTQYGEQFLQNHPSYSMQNSGQFCLRPTPQLRSYHSGNQTSNQDTSQMYRQKYDSVTLAQPMSSEGSQGRVVMANYSGLLKQNVPGEGNPQSLRNKRLNEQHGVNYDVASQFMNNEGGQGRVVTPNYSGVVMQNVPEAENLWSLHNKQLNDQNMVNYSVTSQPNSLDTANQRIQTVGQPSVQLNEHGNRLVMPHHSGEVLPPNKERMWSMENRRLDEQNVSLNRSVSAPHSSHMPSDLNHDQNNHNTTPNQYSNRGTTHLNPVSDQLKGSVQRHPLSPVPDTTQRQGSAQHADMLKVRQGNFYISMQAPDNDPNHPTKQGNQFIDPLRQQQPGHYDNLPGQHHHLNTAGRQGNQPMGVNYNQYREGQISDGAPPRQGKKVFILHYDDVPEVGGVSPVLQLAVALRQLHVDVAVDLFERDISSSNWSFWYEENIRKSDVVLCMITEGFYQKLTTGNRVMGYSLYNLMNSSNIAVRAVFLNAPKNLELAPPAIRGATAYQINTNRLDVHNNEEFASLYAFLTGQNRIEKPPLGNMVKLAPKRSRCEFC